MEKYRVDLTGEERATSEGLFTTGKGAARQVAHARILLWADAGEGDGSRAEAWGQYPHRLPGPQAIGHRGLPGCPGPQAPTAPAGQNPDPR